MALEEWLRIRPEPGAKLGKLRPGGSECYLGLLPWYHSFGQTVIMLGACYSGNKLVARFMPAVAGVHLSHQSPPPPKPTRLLSQVFEQSAENRFEKAYFDDYLIGKGGKTLLSQTCPL